MTPKPIWQRPAAKTQKNEESQVSQEPPVENVPKYLLENDQSSMGVAVGYLKVNRQTTTGNWLIGRVHAEAETAYKSGVFYKKNDQIYVLDVATKKSEQLTMGQYVASDPVFASVSQRLAFSQGSCTVSAKDLTTKTEVVVKEGQSSGQCYKPVAWSPDGNKLAFVGIESKNSPDLGLVGFGTLYIYDFVLRSLTKYDAPTGYNSVKAYSAVAWKDNAEVIVSYVQWGKFASILKEQMVKIDVVSKATSEINTGVKFDLASLRTIGAREFAIGESPRQMLSGPTDGSNQFAPIDGGQDVGTYLLKVNSEGTAATDVYMLNGSAGSQDSFRLYVLPASGGQKAELYTPSDFSAYALGWGLSYDELIYMAVLSGKSEIHQYDISIKKDQVLVSDLPLIQ